MIEAIGLKRLIILAAVLLTNAALASAWFFWLDPEMQNKDRELKNLTNSITKLTRNVQNIKNDIKTTQDNLPDFEVLQAQAFLEEPSSEMIRNTVLNAIKTSGVKSTDIDLTDAVGVEDDRAEKAGYKLVKRELTFSNIQSYTDIEIFDMINTIDKSFPGHTRLENIFISRSKKDITQGDILQLAEPENTMSFVNANVTLSWWFLLSNEIDATVPELGGTL